MSLSLVSAGQFVLAYSALRGTYNFILVEIYLFAIAVSINSLSEWTSVIKKEKKNRFKISNKKEGRKRINDQH